MSLIVETSIEMHKRTLGNRRMFVEVTVPTKLHPQIKELYPKFDCHGLVKVYTTSEGYRLSSVGDVYNSYHRHVYFMTQGLDRELLWDISSSELPEFLRELVNKEEVRIQKERLDRLKNLRYADMDEASFNRKDF